jgi:hypothetical protein
MLCSEGDDSRLARRFALSCSPYFSSILNANAVMSMYTFEDRMNRNSSCYVVPIYQVELSAAVQLISGGSHLVLLVSPQIYMYIYIHPLQKFQAACDLIDQTLGRRTDT